MKKSVEKRPVVPEFTHNSEINTYNIHGHPQNEVVQVTTSVYVYICTVASKLSWKVTRLCCGLHSACALYSFREPRAREILHLV